MSFWDTFHINGRVGPKYLAICDALAEAIHKRQLGPGRQLPSHRMLARRLGVSVGTVTRAYEEALARHLITGEIGRGTFVSHHPEPPLAVVGAASRFPGARLDLCQNLPVAVPEVENPAWVNALDELVQHYDLAALARGSWSEVGPRQRRAGAAWIGRTGLDVPPERVFDCPGTIATLCAIVGAVAEPGDLVLAAALSHPIVASLCEQYGLELQGLAVDAHGILPEAFDAACHRRPPRLLYAVPTIHSPTTHTMPDERRRELGEIACRHEVWIIEDESSSFLLDEPPRPIAAEAPERTFFMGDVWLALSLGLRTTYLLAPEPALERMAAAIAASSGVTAPLIAEIAATWIESDVAEELIRARRAELGLRNAIAGEVLGRRALHQHPSGHHVWLDLPEPWKADLFVLRAEQLGIAVSGADWFALGPGPVPAGVRLCIGNAPDRATLRAGLELLDRLIDAPTSGWRPAL